ncbi:sigma-54-dependent transcriptional regulator [Parachitinimonas caeni]|uniref:Sigma-54 dependent transcriptional regulator n=1 Tax=Parachitinimonas caeni TaxID=3031301 RepID=A0ABT7DWZ1_9NEIS|nr:sigma-54 dependent transcriptional regulator [Parachitinimonas caeni]MDK2123162.1 sigma-54 dependent transcriptional regulator [Parachitinimonas caeni]
MTAPLPGLLIVDDDALICDTLSFVLSDSYAIRTAASRNEAIAVATSVEFKARIALVDLGLPPSPHRPDEGFRLVVELLALQPDIKVIVLSGQSSPANAMHARTLGAIDFVAKPADPKEIRTVLAQALNVQTAERAMQPALEVAGLIGQSPLMERLKRQIHQFASAPFPVLIIGESGSGKEAVAKALHSSSPRHPSPFLALNCAALNASLIEATLFGHAKGAFTGATGSKAGYFEEAGEGTLFLDEIGELPLDLQSKLLRVLENGEYQRVGETQTRQSHARIVAATNRDLRQLSRLGEFRSDLYHRLSVLTIETPALRELEDDRWVLLEHFSKLYANELNTRLFQLDDPARQLFEHYSFPGNVRELRNIAIRLLAKHPGERVSRQILEAELDSEALDSNPVGSGNLDLTSAKRALQTASNFNLDQVLRHWEQTYIDAALKLADGNMSQAARLLGINRTTLYSRLDALRETNRR